MGSYKYARESRIKSIEHDYKMRKKYKKERFEIGDILEFTGKEYNLAKILNYEDKFKNKDLVIENIQRCPCEENKNDQIKFKGIERLLSLCFF